MTPVPRALTILDPTSLVGREVAERVAESFPDVRRVFFHTGHEEEHLITDVAGAASLVPPLVDLDELSGSLAIVLTQKLPPALAVSLATWLRANPSGTVLDVSGTSIAPKDSLTVLGAADLGSGARWLRLPDPTLAGTTHFLRALAPTAPSEAHVTLISPASTFGPAALEELAAQGATRLSGRRPPRPTLLPTVLAFDLTSGAEERRASLEGQLSALVPAVAVHVHLLDAGVFHGHLATVSVRCDNCPGRDRIRDLLRRSEIIRLAKTTELPRPSDAVGNRDVTCMGLRVDRPWISAVLLADGHRLLAVEPVIELLSALLMPRAGQSWS